jgi:outer membrane protein W
MEERENYVEYCELKKLVLSVFFFDVIGVENIVDGLMFPHMLQSAETQKTEQDPSHSIPTFLTAQFQFF